jgi:hypothetical protein
MRHVKAHNHARDVAGAARIYGGRQNATRATGLLSDARKSLVEQSNDLDWTEAWARFSGPAYLDDLSALTHQSGEALCCLPQKRNPHELG